MVLVRFSLVVASLTLLLQPGSSTGTNFTHDIVDGYPVITSLDLADAPPNAITRYYFRAAQAQGTVYYDIPVVVVRGTNESLHTGKKLSLSSTVHGDELNGIRVIQNILKTLEPQVRAGTFNGTIIALPTVNPNGVQHNQRNFFSSSENGFLTNLNRVFPGKDIAHGGKLPDLFAYNIWNGLWQNTSNVDVAVDMHTLTIADAGPMWVYADYRLPYVRRLAELSEADVIKIDPGEKGSIETAWVSQAIPAVTFELGSPKMWDPQIIDRGEKYMFRLMQDLNMIASDGPVVPDLSHTYIVDTRTDVECENAGFAEYLVAQLNDVAKGQDVVKIYNTFGDLIETIQSPVSGRVLEIRTDPAVEPGSTVIALVSNSTTTATS